MQQEQIEDALSSYLAYLTEYVRKKRLEEGWMSTDVDLSDFAWFSHQNRDTVGDLVLRNALSVVNLALLALLGFVGAHVAMLRYDVR